MAEQLLKLYAEREQDIGFNFSSDFPWQRDFEDAFAYIETDDQLKSVEEIKEDIPEPSKYVDFKDPNFIMALNSDTHPDNKNVKQFLVHLAICHTVVPI